MAKYKTKLKKTVLNSQRIGRFCLVKWDKNKWESRHKYYIVLGDQLVGAQRENSALKDRREARRGKALKSLFFFASAVF